MLASNSNATENRFEFGKNWLSYAELIDQHRIDAAKERMLRFLQVDSLEGKTFIDIGCGSGLHSLAALQLGAKQVYAIDYDMNAVRSTKQILQHHYPNGHFKVEQRSVFDLSKDQDGVYDIVYSWGVLHHTGNMSKAVEAASGLVSQNGLFAISLYAITPYCHLWKKIKKWYVNTTDENKRKAEKWYSRLFGWYLLLRGKTLKTHLKNYSKNKRGMNFEHDVKDWIGGYPYESISPKDTHEMVNKLGFELKREKVIRPSGLFGSGCNEYLFTRTSTS